MDALWMRLSNEAPRNGSVLLGRIQGRAACSSARPRDYWQCAFVIPKGGLRDLRRRGLPAFRQAIVDA
jgi:hypothetical protein